MIFLAYSMLGIVPPKRTLIGTYSFFVRELGEFINRKLELEDYKDHEDNKPTEK